MRTWITLLVLVAVVYYGAVQFSNSIAGSPLANLRPEVTAEQVMWLVLLMVGLLGVYRTLDDLSGLGLLSKNIDSLEKMEAILTGRRTFVQLSRWISLGFLVLLILFSGLVSLLSMFGGVAGNISTPEQLGLKITLTVVATVLVIQESARFEDVRRVSAVIKQYVIDRSPRRSPVEVLDRPGFHKFLLAGFPTYSEKDRVFVTSFETTVVPFRQEGYMIEKEFMSEWFQTITKTHLRVDQLVIVSTSKDVADLETRVTRIKDLPNFNLSCIVAPPLPWFVDFFLREGEFALTAYSTDPATRNMDTDAICVPDARVAELLRRSFEATAMPKAIHIKTREGVLKENLALVKRIIDRVEASRDKHLRALFTHGFLREDL
jgi:hypothetical protein